MRLVLRGVPQGSVIGPLFYAIIRKKENQETNTDAEDHKTTLREMRDPDADLIMD